MSDTARIGHRLQPATFVFCARDAILRPDLHGHANDVIALFPQQIGCDAGVHSTAHAKQDSLFLSIHVSEEFRSSGAWVNVSGEHSLPASAFRQPAEKKRRRQAACAPRTKLRTYCFTARLRNGLPRKVNRHGKCAERLIPMRLSATTSKVACAFDTKQWRGSAHKSISWCRSVMPSACVSFPGPEQSWWRSSTRRRFFISSTPRRGSSARIKTKPFASPFTSTFNIQCTP